MKETDVVELGFNVTNAAKIAAALTGKLPYDSGYFFGWLKFEANVGIIDELHVGWQVTDIEGNVRETAVYLRPIFIDNNITAYVAPTYNNLENIAGVGAGFLPVDGEWYGFVLFNPAAPCPIPLLEENDQLKFTVTGTCAGGTDDFTATILLLSEKEKS